MHQVLWIADTGDHFLEVDNRFLKLSHFHIIERHRAAVGDIVGIGITGFDRLRQRPFTVASKIFRPGVINGNRLIIMKTGA